MEFLEPGSFVSSPGCSFTYEIIAPVCRLFDRSQMPWPCCSLDWKGKSPSWRRVGKQLVPDIAAKTHFSYVAKIAGMKRSTPFLLTFYHVKLSETEQEWWYSKTPYLKRIDQGQEDSLAA